MTSLGDRTGRAAEIFAALALMTKGFSIIARRYKTPLGEIDLIARRGKLLIFAEVKARACLDAAAAAVSPAAWRRINNAAGAYLARHPHLARCDMRYDILAIAGWRVRHIKDAWRDHR
jgi:putative endonuclease